MQPEHSNEPRTDEITELCIASGTMEQAVGRVIAYEMTQLDATLPSIPVVEERKYNNGAEYIVVTVPRQPTPSEDMIAMIGGILNAPLCSCTTRITEDGACEYRFRSAPMPPLGPHPKGNVTTMKKLAGRLLGNNVKMFDDNFPTDYISHIFGEPPYRRLAQKVSLALAEQLENNGLYSGAPPSLSNLSDGQGVVMQFQSEPGNLRDIVNFVQQKFDSWATCTTDIQAMGEPCTCTFTPAPAIPFIRTITPQDISLEGLAKKLGVETWRVPRKEHLGRSEAPEDTSPAPNAMLLEVDSEDDSSYDIESDGEQSGAPWETNDGLQPAQGVPSKLKFLYNILPRIFENLPDTAELTIDEIFDACQQRLYPPEEFSSREWLEELLDDLQEQQEVTRVQEYPPSYRYTPLPETRQLASAVLHSGQLLEQESDSNFELYSSAKTLEGAISMMLPVVMQRDYSISIAQPEIRRGEEPDTVVMTFRNGVYKNPLVGFFTGDVEKLGGNIAQAIGNSFFIAVSYERLSGGGVQYTFRPTTDNIPTTDQSVKSKWQETIKTSLHMGSIAKNLGIDTQLFIDDRGEGEKRSFER